MAVGGGIGIWLSWVGGPLLLVAPAVEVGVVPTVVTGDATPAFRQELQDAVVNGTERAGVVAEMLAAADEECDAACIAARGRAEGLDYIIRARVTSEARLYEVELEAVRSRDGSLAASSRYPCRPCGQSEVAELLEREVATLATRLAELEATPAAIVIESSPAGAEIRVDGEPVGVGPTTVHLSPGTHEIELELPGYEVQRRRVEAVAGVEERWAPRLHERATATADGEDRELLWPIGWALLGTGVASTATGATFLALHHRPYRSRCSGPDYDADNDLCRYRWTSLPQGATLTAVGGALVVGGAVLTAIGHRRRRRSASLRAAATIQPGGGVLHVMGRF